MVGTGLRGRRPVHAVHFELAIGSHLNKKPKLRGLQGLGVLGVLGFGFWGFGA